MRLIFKILAFPFVLLTGILYDFCKFFVLASGAVMGILSGIIFLAALVLFFIAGFWPGMSWLVLPSSGASIVRKKYTNSRAWALACIWLARS